MPSRSFLLRLGCALVLAACGFALAEAGTNAPTRAQVFTRDFSKQARLIFSWDSHEKVPFTLHEHGNRVVLHFVKPVTLRWNAGLEAVQSYIKGVETQDGGNTVVLTLNRSAKARYLYLSNRDDSDKNGIELVPSAPSPSEATVAADELPDLPQGHGYKEPARPHARPDGKIREAKAKPAASAIAKSAAMEAQKLEAQKLAALSPAAGTPIAGATVSAIQGPPLSPAMVNMGPPAPPSPPAPPPEAVIGLPFKPGEPFAVFTLHNKLWIVGEHFNPPSAYEMQKTGAPFVRDAEVLPATDATVLTVKLDEGVSASVRKTPTGAIQLLLATGPTKLAHALVPSLETAPNTLNIDAGKALQLLTVPDPATGNNLSVIPSDEPGRGIATPRSFVEFNLLPSAQGVAVESLSDKLSVKLDKGLVQITTAGGLEISPETAQVLKEMESEAAFDRLPPTLFPYARWKLDDEKNFQEAQIKLYHDIAFGTPDSSNKARLKLLGLYLGEGLFPEALGVSDDILRISLKFYRENKVSALRGAAYFFMYRIHEAQRDFSAPELKGDVEAAYWLALCNELLGEGTQPFDFAANYDRYISHYPPSFIGKLGIIAADRHINRKEYDAASTIFETLKRDNFDEPVKKYIDYMRAKIFSETHSESEAVKIWEEQAKDLSDPLIRARAEFSLINLLLKNEKISHNDAIKRLEKLRIVWRGDSLELGVLTLLGNLYLDNKQYAEALHTMRDIVLYFPQVPEAITTARKMETTFVSLYNKDGASSMPPLEAMSLFYEYRDLVPLGAAGDQMIRNLADRLVSIDLLDRAAMLLEHQIKNRLQGQERSRVGAHLAHIYLLNRQPDKALETLKTTGFGDLPGDLQLQRLRLTAQALAQQGKVEKAIAVISGDNSTEGEQLRLSIYWDNKNWQNVTTMAEDILGNRPDPSAPLNKPESEVLLKLATAYVYQHDTGQLQYLRDYFTPLMKNNPNRDSFLFITSESGTVDYDNLANLEQDMGTVKSFLDKSNDAPGKNGLSRAAN